MRADAAERPFDDPSVVAGYEGWQRLAYARLAIELETGLLEEALAGLRPGARVLEIGCGTGSFAEVLRRRGHWVVGADPSARMLAVARGRVPVVRAAAEDLPFADGAFDAAFFFSVLDFVDDPARCLAEAQRVSTDRVAVLALNTRSWIGAWRRIASLRGHPIFSRARFVPRRRLDAMARAAGAPQGPVRGVRVLPPSLTTLLPGLERRLSRGRNPFAGIVAHVLPGRRRRSGAASW